MFVYVLQTKYKGLRACTWRVSLSYNFSAIVLWIYTIQPCLFYTFNDYINLLIFNNNILWWQWGRSVPDWHVGHVFHYFSGLPEDGTLVSKHVELLLVTNCILLSAFFGSYIESYRQHRQVTEELYITWLKLHYLSSHEFWKWGAVGRRRAHNTLQKSWCPVSGWLSWRIPLQLPGHMILSLETLRVSLFGLVERWATITKKLRY
jgi:hypothetical protein